MSQTNNFIELNGNRYDATTGAFLGSASAQLPTPARPTVAPPVAAARHGGAMDGVVHAGAAHPTATSHTPQSAPHHVRPLAAHRPQHPQTLRRDVVAPPNIELKQNIKPQMPTDMVAHQSDVLAVAPKLSSQAVDPARATRAQAVPHSPQIERFRPVRPQQYNDMRSAIAASPSLQPATRPVDSFAPASPATAPRPMQHHAQPAQPAGNNDIFEHALHHARSHEQPAPKESTQQMVKRAGRRHKRTVRVAAGALMVVLLGSFIFWQNRANVELELASARSGVPASMPGYKPAGFTVKGLTYTPGTVTIGFRGNSDKSFNVVQKSSNWDSQTLLENYVATSGQPYNAYQAAGRTVYLYGNGDATWVNGGVWYQVNDNGLLSKDQIVNLATSM